MTARKDSAYTNGVIAVREKKLLKEKLVRMCSLNADEARSILTDSGFGGSEPFESVEELILRDEREIDAFIREYSPSREITEYLLAPRDFHNAKALVKARYLNTDATPLLGSEGNYSVAVLKRAVEEGVSEGIEEELKQAIAQAGRLLEENASGAEAGFLFDNALNAYLDRVLSRHGVCKKLLVRRADMTNLLTAFRAEEEKIAKKFFLAGGSLAEEKLCAVFGGTENARKAFERSPYEEFVKVLCAAKEGGSPFTEAEKMLESAEFAFFAERPYELSDKGKFLYYVLRRRTENENVRIVFVCLSAGLRESEIIKRLRGVQ